MFRSMMFAGAAMMMTMAAAPASAGMPMQMETARCEAMSFRIYFDRSSATMDQAAMDMMAAAERQMAGCDYAELRMMMDPSMPMARERAEAIMMAASDREWDAVRMEWSMMQRASMRIGPDYVEVTMSPEPMDMPMQMDMAARNEAGA